MNVGGESAEKNTGIHFDEDSRASPDPAPSFEAGQGDHADSFNEDSTLTSDSSSVVYVGTTRQLSMKSLYDAHNTTVLDKSVTFAAPDDLIQEIKTSRNDSFLHKWCGVQRIQTYEIVERYAQLCSDSHTVMQDTLLDQLKEIKNNIDYSAVLNLAGVVIDYDAMEALEMIFQCVTFSLIYLTDCLPFHAMEFFHMLEYYDPVTKLILNNVKWEETAIWRSFADTAAKSSVLCSVSFRDTELSDGNIRLIVQSGLNKNSHMKKIRFEGCTLTRAPTFLLMHYLERNMYCRELHLCYVDLYSKEAEILGKFLAINTTLQVLNLSNNILGDHGFEELSHGLLAQAKIGMGVQVLILYNNQLSSRSVATLNVIIASCPLIHTINVGLNQLTDLVICNTEDSIKNSSSLRALGLQSTLLTCVGITKLVEVCEINSSLWHLNLRGNKAILPDALNSLADSIHKTSLKQIDLDDKNRSCSDPQKYLEIVNKVRQVISINKMKDESQYPNEIHSSREENFLNCESTYVPKPRTKICKPSMSTHRFHVEAVEEVENRPIVATRKVGSRFTIISFATPDDAIETAEQGDGVNLRNDPILESGTNAAGDFHASLVEEEDNISIITLSSGEDTMQPPHEESGDEAANAAQRVQGRLGLGSSPMWTADGEEILLLEDVPFAREEIVEGEDLVSADEEEEDDDADDEATGEEDITTTVSSDEERMSSS